MNKKIALLGLSTFASVLSMSSCTSVGEHKSSSELYYTNSTQADSEEYTFLRTVYQLASDEVEFAKIISQKGGSANIKSLAANLTNQYGGVLTKIGELAKNADVLIPFSAASKFELKGGLDSAQSSVLEKEFLKHSLHNQERIIHQFESVEHNTKVATNRYASEILPALEKTVEETKALL